MKTTSLEKSHASRCGFAAAIAAVLLVASGLGFRAVAAHYAAVAPARALPASTLERIPMQLGAWEGKNSPLDEWVVRATDTTDHLSRLYRRPGRGDAATLYIAHGVRHRDLAPHRPEVCYPASGWTADGGHDVRLALDGREMLPVRVLRFSRGGLLSERVLVLNYYIVDDEYCEDVSLLRSKAWRWKRDTQYITQVQIAAPVPPLTDADQVEESLRDLATASAPAIRQALTAARRSTPADARTKGDVASPNANTTPD